MAWLCRSNSKNLIHHLKRRTQEAITCWDAMPKFAFFSTCKLFHEICFHSAVVSLQYIHITYNDNLSMIQFFKIIFNLYTFQLPCPGDEMAELLVSGQLAFMLARSVPSSTISLQTALHILTYNLLLCPGEEMAELLVSRQLAFMLGRSVPSSTISLQI